MDEGWVSGGPEAARQFERLLIYHPYLLSHLQDLLNAVVAYVPRIVVQTMLDAPTLEPYALPVEGTVMFADIDGFTPLAEQFSASASEEGADLLTGIVNQFLELLIQACAQYGGDLQKFGGDAGMVLFTGPDHALRAIAAGLEVQRQMLAALSEVSTPFGVFPLRVSIGLGSGRMVGMSLGTQAGREWFLSGPPLRGMGRAQSATPPERVGMDLATLQACEQKVRVSPLEHDLYLVEELLAQPTPTPAEIRLLIPEASPMRRLLWLMQRLDTITPYLPPRVLENITTAIALDQATRLVSELRKVTILMLSLSAWPDPTIFWDNPAGLRETVLAQNREFVQIRDIIQRYDGIVNKIGSSPQGAFLMAIFGAPVSHEDDALRAVLTALELQEEAEIPLRIGINAGFVFAGDVGSAQRREYTVMGDEVNLAYRLMTSARPGETWIGPKTARESGVQRRVEGETLPPQVFKGIREPLAPFLARRLRRSFIGVEVSGGKVVGRSAEQQRLQRALELAEAGRSQVILLSGPAGVGKSTLVQDALTRAQALHLLPCVGIAPTYGTHLPYAVWEAPLLALLHLDEVPPAERAATLLKRLAQFDLAPWAALLAPLMGLDIAPSPEVSALSPAQREAQRVLTFRLLWERAARVTPALLVIENAQWLSPAALELLDALLRQPLEAPLAILITCRDEETILHHWAQIGQQDWHLCPLNPLPSQAMVDIVRQAARTDTLPREVERWLVKRSSGLPLFAIEGLQSLLAAGLLEEHNGQWQLTGPLEEVSLPENVYALVQSRIDQLDPPGRHLLRAAAVIGEQMTLPMLVAGYGEESERAVQRRLPRLGPLGLVSGDDTGQTLIFRQPLVREVAFRGLPARIQRAIHARLAVYLDQQREHVTSNWLALLAYHAFEGQVWDLALWANMELGERSLQAYLTTQARQAFMRTLEALQLSKLVLPDLSYKAHHLLGETLSILGQYEEALQHFEAAQTYLPDPPMTLEDMRHFAHVCYHRASALEALGRYEDAFAAVRRGLALPSIETTLEGAQLMLIGAGLYHRQGRSEEAETWAARSSEVAISLPDEEAQKVHARALYLRAVLASVRGEMECAVEFGTQSVELYRHLLDLMGEMNALTNLCLVNLNRGAWDEAVKQGESALRIAQRINHLEGKARILANLGELYRYRGDFAKAREAYTTALEIVHERGMAYGEALMENNLAALALAEGQLDEARDRLERAFALFEKIRAERMYAELYRHKAEWLLLCKALDEARTWAQRAFEQAQQLKSQVEMGLAQLCLAEIALAADALEEALRTSLEAAQMLERAGDRYNLGRAWLVAAQVAVRQQNFSRARAYAEQAQALFKPLGARPLLESVAALVKALPD